MAYEERTRVSISVAADGEARIMYDHLEDGEWVTTTRQMNYADIEGLRRLLRDPGAFGRTANPEDGSG